METHTKYSLHTEVGPSFGLKFILPYCQRLRQNGSRHVLFGFCQPGGNQVLLRIPGGSGPWHVRVCYRGPSGSGPRQKG